jgi:hypothetical protein
MSGLVHFPSALALEVGVVPFVLATPHHAAAEVVEQIDQAVAIALATASGGATPAIGTTAASATLSRVCGPKLPPLQ